MSKIVDFEQLWTAFQQKLVTANKKLVFFKMFNTFCWFTVQSCCLFSPCNLSFPGFYWLNWIITSEITVLIRMNSVHFCAYCVIYYLQSVQNCSFWPTFKSYPTKINDSQQKTCFLQNAQHFLFVYCPKVSIVFIVNAEKRGTPFSCHK